MADNADNTDSNNQKTTVDVVETVSADGHSKIVTTKTTTTTKVVSTSNSTAALGRYEDWVNANVSLARNVETFFYIAPQFVPKTKVDPLLATQTGYAIAGLLHLLHDHILYKSTNPEGAKPPTITQRFTRLIRVPLSLVSTVQVAAEVAANKLGGDAGKWKLIVWLEIVKSVLRLILISQQRRGMLARGGKYKGIESSPKPSAFARFTKKSEKRGARTGKTFSAKNTQIESTATPQDESVGVNVISFDNPAFEVEGNPHEGLLVGGEILHILRPVVYALLRQRRTESDWTPLLVSFLVEASGLALSTAALKPAKVEQENKAAAELSARKMALLLYFLRDPLYNSVTMPAVGKTSDVLEYIPVVGKGFRVVSHAILNYYHQFHFYTSAS